MNIITQDTRTPTPMERLADYFAKPAAIERRPMPVLPWDVAKEYERDAAAWGRDYAHTREY